MPGGEEQVREGAVPSLHINPSGNAQSDSILQTPSLTKLSLTTFRLLRLKATQLSLPKLSLAKRSLTKLSLLKLSPAKPRLTKLSRKIVNIVET